MAVPVVGCVLKRLVKRAVATSLLSCQYTTYSHRDVQSDQKLNHDSARVRAQRGHILYTRVQVGIYGIRNTTRMIACVHPVSTHLTWTLDTLKRNVSRYLLAYCRFLRLLYVLEPCRAANRVHASTHGHVR